MHSAPRYLIERRTDHGGRTLHFVTRTGRRPWVKVFELDEVPPFEGDSAWFEIERKPGKPVRLVGPFDQKHG